MNTQAQLIAGAIDAALDVCASHCLDNAREATIVSLCIRACIGHALLHGKVPSRLQAGKYRAQAILNSESDS